MSDRCSEADWRVYKDVIDAVLERYSRSVVERVSALLADESKPAPERLWDADEATRKAVRHWDRRYSELSRSAVLTHVVGMHAEGLLEPEELASFSEDIRATAEAVARRRR